MNNYMQQIRDMVVVRDALAGRSAEEQRVLKEADPGTLELAHALAAGAPQEGGPPEQGAFVVHSTQASVTPQQALSLLHRCLPTCAVMATPCV